MDFALAMMAGFIPMFVYLGLKVVNALEVIAAELHLANQPLRDAIAAKEAESTADVS